MKVSKLFHWLYAFLMLLPIFAISSVVLVNTFNIEAKNESNIIYKYETNDVNSVDDLKVGNIYHFEVESPSEFLSIGQFHFAYNVITIGQTISEISNFIECYANGESILYFKTLVNDEDFYITFRLTSYISMDLVYTDDWVNSDVKQYFSKCINIPIERVEQKNISNVFYDSLEQVKNSSVFSWAMNSFLVIPFTFIVNLFGMPTNSIIVLLLSYWLDIAIIWLVFDLIMYVPQLVHRWIDKGMLE